MQIQSGEERIHREPHIRAESLSIGFQHGETQIAVLDNVTFDINRNECLSVMGPSGCGKTTLLNILAGFVRPSSGRVTIGERVVTGVGPDRAVVFQEDAVFPWMTVEQNIGFSPRVRRMSKRRRREIVDRYIEMVHLEEFRKAWPKQLSGGMKKRVDMARGYAADPEVLLLDEPFGALDIMTKERLQEDLHNLWRAEPRTMVFITHDVEEALFLGDRVMLLTPRPGRIAGLYQHAFPIERDRTFKVDPRFVAARREILEDILVQEILPQDQEILPAGHLANGGASLMTTDTAG